jgi:hypothetical protein
MENGVSRHSSLLAHPRAGWISAATKLIGSLRDFRYVAAIRTVSPSDLSPCFVVAMPSHGKWSLDMDYAKPADVVASRVFLGNPLAAQVPAE